MQLFHPGDEKYARYKDIVEMAELKESIYKNSGTNEVAKSNLFSRLCHN